MNTTKMIVPLNKNKQKDGVQTTLAICHNTHA